MNDPATYQVILFIFGFLLFFTWWFWMVWIANKYKIKETETPWHWLDGIFAFFTTLALLFKSEIPGVKRLQILGTMVVFMVALYYTAKFAFQ